MSNSQEPTHRTAVVASAILPDGAVLEMVSRSEDQRTAFLIHRDGAIAEHREFDIPGVGRATPYSQTNNLIAHSVVLFPSGVADYDSQVALLAEVRNFIHRYADLSESFEELASLYVLLSWVYDRFNAMPYLRLKGDYGSGKSRCLQTIGSICYKPMFVSGASTVSPMFRIIDAFRGTLILDESDFRFSDERAEIIKILNNGNAVGFPVLRSEATPTKEFNPRAFAVFGPKVIATRREFDDQALESRCITEIMSGLPPRADIPLSLPAGFANEACALRNKLLMYRFNNHAQYGSVSERQDSAIEARVAQIYQPLLAVAPDEAARERVLAHARIQTGALRAVRGASVESQLLDTLYVMRQAGAPFYVRDITTRFADKYGADFDRPVTARWVGGQLRKRLSLVTLKSHGMYVVPVTEQAKLDALFARYATEDDAVDMGTMGTF